MRLYRTFLQTLGAMSLLALALACSGKKKGTDPAAVTTATLTGTITYQRVPLAFDGSGKPTGLVDASVSANLTSLPARSVVIRAYQQVEQTQPNGSTTLVWILANTAITNSTGAYTLSVTKDRPTMVEVLSTFSAIAGDQINLIAEPGGINSQTSVLSRLHYALRKAADGTAPAGDNTPKSVITENATLNFSVGLSDPWWVVNPELTPNSTAPFVGAAVLETSLPGRSTGSGSRILGIGDTIATFVTNYGAATAGSTLDLHYWPGRSEPRGSFIEYNRSVFPQAYDPTTGKSHFFGSLQAGPANDDAWDEGVILPLLTRNLLYTGLVGRTYSVPLNVLFPPGAPLTDLSPEIARIEGLADAMAANLLKSPYLADTQGTGLATPLKDIRDISALSASQLGPTSAPALRALGWEIILKANSLPTPGTSTNWATINPLVAARFFLTPGTSLAGVTDPVTSRDLEPLNIFSQLSRLREAKSNAETVDLVTLFPDASITTLAAPFGITWPRPTAGLYGPYATFWGTDPVGPFPAVTLSMAKAVKVNMPVVAANLVDYQLAYPNLSPGELAYAGFSLTADKRCILTATISPALPSTGHVEVDLPGLARTFSFTGTGGTTETLLIPVGGTAPVFHPVRLHMKSPDIQQPDTTVTLTLTPAP